MDNAIYNQDIINLLPSIVIPLLGCFLPLIVTIYWNKRNNPLDKERFYKVIFPIYDLLLPYYNSTDQKAINDALEKALKIANDEKLLAGYELIQKLSRSKDKLFSRDFKKFLEREYDKYCSRLGVPLRSTVYRLNSKTKLTSKYTFFAFVQFLMPLLTFLISLIALLLALLIPLFDNQGS